MPTITKAQQELITDAVLFHGFKDKVEALHQREEAVRSKLYEASYSKVLREKAEEVNTLLISNKLNKTFSSSEAVRFSMQGVRRYLGRTPDSVTFRALKNYKPDYTSFLEIDPYHMIKCDESHPLYNEIFNVLKDGELLVKEIRTRRREVEAILEANRTTTKLEAVWPEIMPLVYPLVPVEAKVPMVIPQSLNVALKLPPEPIQATV